ncbi:spermatogenesis-associated serine-rich protein 1-like [Clavelina lepadiformis]|uniref:spermatogenesis-associated serine-rich protein 1-like n=1 Tax=Clavelina lepadiformis TaxID=159417 RepID=UPI0040414125
MEKNATIKSTKGNGDGIAKSAKGRGRLYIPHGYGKEKVYKPHTEHIDVAYTQCGPDWSSRLRWLPSPKPAKGKPKDNMFQPPMKSIRHFPAHQNRSSKKEYTFYPPHGMPLVFGKGKVTKFHDVHKASQVSRFEITDSMRFGNHSKVPDPRNGILEASPGDKPYQAVEYSINFHKHGSTRPMVNFGCLLKPVMDPVVIAKARTKPYTIKEAERQHLVDVNSVKELDNWRPATPLRVPVPETRA